MANCLWIAFTLAQFPKDSENEKARSLAFEITPHIGDIESVYHVLETEGIKGRICSQYDNTEVTIEKLTSQKPEEIDREENFIIYADLVSIDYSLQKFGNLLKRLNADTTTIECH